MVEVRIQVLRSRVHQGSQILPVQNRVDVFGFLFPLPRLFCHQLRQAQVGYMLSFVSHPYHHDVEFWSRQISSFALHAARAAVLEGRSGFLMDVGISIRMVARFPWSIFYRGAELVDESLILSSDGGFGEADEPANEILMIPSEESADSRGEFGGVPASKSSINALETRSFQEDQSASACVICLEDLEAGVEVTAMPCSHEFHRSCLSNWLEKSHLCPLCRFPMPTVGSRVPHRATGVGQ